MWSNFFQFILDKFPFIAIIIIAMGIAVWVTKKYLKTLGRVNNIEKQCKECKNDKFPGLNSHFEKIDNSLSGISQSLIALAVYLKGKDEKLDVSLIISRSPIQLSNFGNRILNDINGKKIIDENLSLFFADMDQQNFKSGLDAHNYSINLIMNMFNNDIFTPIKDYLYNNPIYKFKTEKGEDIEYPLDVNDIYTIIGIYLRNKYLEKYPDLVKNWEGVKS